MPSQDKHTQGQPATQQNNVRLFQSSNPSRSLLHCELKWSNRVTQSDARLELCKVESRTSAGHVGLVHLATQLVHQQLVTVSAYWWSRRLVIWNTSFYMYITECTVHDPLTLLFFLISKAPDFVGERGGEWGKQVGSMNEESQVRGCCNITFICNNQKTVSVLEKTQANKTFRTWKQT